jgi:hypothetical protein
VDGRFHWNLGACPPGSDASTAASGQRRCAPDDSRKPICSFGLADAVCAEALRGRVSTVFPTSRLTLEGGGNPPRDRVES